MRLGLVIYRSLVKGMELLLIFRGDRAMQAIDVVAEAC